MQNVQTSSLIAKSEKSFFHHTFVPLALMIGCPPIVILIWYTNAVLGGSISELASMMKSQGFFSGLYSIWAPVFWGSKAAWSIIGIYAAFELLLMRFIPGKLFKGPVTPAGNVPVYKANGIACYTITLGAFWLFSMKFKLFSASILYDHLGEILGALNVASLCLCLVLYLKGKFKPSSTDAQTTGNFIFDYYWGVELYPRVLGFDIKMFTNCRFAMMGWSLLIISYAAKQAELYGLSSSMLVCVLLQLVYVTKFFIWETGYLGSLDIMHDHAGFYICWGVLVWLPCVYTSSAMYLVHHPIMLGTKLATMILTLGIIAVLTNFWADKQRQDVRAKKGECKVWGRTPLLTHASYTTETGEKKDSILLASGFWGIARHFHYVPEILGAFFWSLPALSSSYIPYFYVSFLTILLVHRALRDDQRCAIKYGKYWQEHCSKVRYKVLPFIY